MAAHRISYGVILFFVTLFYIFYDGYLSLYVFIAAWLLPVFSLALSIPVWALLQAELALEEKTVKAGESFPVKVAMKSKWIFAANQARFILVGKNLLTGETEEESFFFTMSPFPVTLEHRAQSLYCGELRFSVPRLRCYDYLGLFSWRRRDLERELERFILCLPKVYPLEVTLDYHRPSPEGEGRYSPTRPGQDPTELFGLREYHEGDKLSRVDWKVSSKLQTMMVKEMSMPLSCRLLFCLYPQGTGAEQDALLSAFASLANRVLEEGEPFWVAYCMRGGWERREITKAEELFALWPFLLRSPGSSEEAPELPPGLSHIVTLCSQPEPRQVMAFEKALSFNGKITALCITPGQAPENIVQLPLFPQGVSKALQGMEL